MKSFYVFIGTLMVWGVALASHENPDSVVDRKGRASLAQIFDCAVQFDAACVLDRSEDVLAVANRNFWAEADREAVKVTGRAEESASASDLADSISKIFAEMADIFKNGLDGLFRDAKENDEDEIKTDNTEAADDDDDDDEEEKEEDGKSRGLTEEARGKKKKKRKAIIKLFLLGLALKAKLSMLLKIFAAHLQVKFLLIALAGLIINAIRLFFDLKKGHHPQKVIYYEHAQHQHHYDGGEEDWSGGHWGRSYLDSDSQDNKSAQDMAYAKQKPSGLVYSSVDNKPNYSWN